MKKLLCAALVGALMTTYSAVAADFSKNPYGLVYDNAITENVASKVNIHFKANGGNPSHFVAEGDKIMGFDKWIKEINNQVGTLIGIGQSTTHIFLISDFVKDEKKKTEIEKAILRYCNQ